MLFVIYGFLNTPIQLIIIFCCLKCELVHHKHYKTRSEAHADIFAYIETYYNVVRPQSALNWLSPLAFEQLLSVYAAKVA